MLTWRDLGLERAGPGDGFSPVTLDGPFCGGHGNFSHVFRGTAPDEELVSDVWQCRTCANFTFVLWRGAEGHFHYRAYPYGRPRSAAHPAWPEDVGRAYADAVAALLDEDWQGAVLLARHTIGLATRRAGAEPAGLAAEVAQLASAQRVPGALSEWGARMPQLDDSAEGRTWAAGAAKEAVRFARYLLDTLYTLPHDAGRFRGEGVPEPPPGV